MAESSADPIPKELADAFAHAVLAFELWHPEHEGQQNPFLVATIIRSMLFAALSISLQIHCQSTSLKNCASENRK
jgi:hypothetical protein